jgi:hypothetical protein
MSQDDRSPVNFPEPPGETTMWWTLCFCLRLGKKSVSIS